MSFQEEDEWLGLGSGFVLDDAFKCTSPLGADTSLQVPLREPSPIAVSPQNLMDFSFGDNSLAVPMREFGFQSGNDPPRLSPVSSSYQSMAPLQNMAYEMSSTTVMQEDSYNSFEQPSIVVNGHYQAMEQQVIQPQQGYFQAVSDAPPQQVMSTSHQQQAPTGSSSTSSGSLVQQILSAPSTRQTPTPQHNQHNRQRPIQPKTQNNGRKRGSVNSHSGGNKSTKVDTSANSTNQTEVRFSMSALTRITEIGAEMAQLQEQQEKLGINNSQRLSELQAQRASILYEALSSQNVGETVLSQVKQVAAAAAPTPQPRPTPRSRGSHVNRQTNFETGQESPQYQPQMYLASHNQYPSTSTAQFQKYPTGNGNQTQIVQQEQIGACHQNQQRTYRAQNATTTVYHTQPQLPPGTVYVQNVPQAAQAQFASSQPTVGEVVRQQHQLRHVSGTQQVIVQQVQAAPQVVVATGSQPLTGPQIRSQIVQQSPLPAQIVLAPPVQQSPQLVVLAQRASPAQAAKRLEEKRAGRLSRLRNYFDNLHATLANPDTETPFSDLRDVLQRLLPYHAYGEPNLTEEHLEQFDTNYLRTNINLHEQRKRLEKRLRKVFYDEAMNGTESEERNLLLFLDGEYAKRKLEEEKEFVKQGNLEAFVRDSAIIAASRDSDRETLEKPKLDPSSKPSSSKSVMQQYEYHAFDEVPRAVSPYKSPSPFKSPASSIRSPSPCRSPSSVAYSPRIRARNSSQSIHLSPAPAQEPARTRALPKTRTTSESSKSDKSDVRKTPLPPPLPSVTTRRSTPLRKAADKDLSKSSPMAPSPAISTPGTPSSLASVLSSPTPVTIAPVMPTPVVLTPVESASETAAPEVSTSKRPAPAASPPAASAPVKTVPAGPSSGASTASRVSERKKEVSDVPAAVSTPGRLPAKKELLCRARQGVPAEMRSPPAHTSIATSLIYNRNSLEDEDTDGSASPELGIDDVIPLPVSQQSRSPAPQASVIPESKSIVIPTPPPPRLPPQKTAVPLPPPLPQRKEKLNVPLERTSSPVVKQENVRPPVKPSVEEKPAERFRFKPQVPRPTPVSPLKPTVSKHEPVAELSPIGKNTNCINHCAEDKVQIPSRIRPPPIRLKLKLSGNEVYIENNENSVKDGDKKHRKHKKKKKERHKEHAGGVKHGKEKLRSKGHKKLQNKKEKHGTSPQELVAVTSNGVRMKLKFGAGTNSIGSASPSLSTLSSNESAEVKVKQKVMDPQPSTSKAPAPTTESVRIPRLKIRIGPEAPALVIAPSDMKSASSPPVVQQPSNVPSVSKVIRKSKSPPLISTAHASILPSEPLPVEFSDESDTETERLRCATDKALRGMSNLPGVTRPHASVLPWSTQQAP
ncbi:GLTSCR1 domain-containing protein [Trichostrongylus colubriformis]|uniref:GLTSCR1 domain-containing protein n=1 Tax=Trichostrongylus colubriformis TaxID=6319 RepID=A0AAN8F9K4_TRICO